MKICLNIKTSFFRNDKNSVRRRKNACCCLRKNILSIWHVRLKAHNNVLLFAVVVLLIFTIVVDSKKAAAASLELWYYDNGCKSKFYNGIIIDFRQGNAQRLNAYLVPKGQPIAISTNTVDSKNVHKTFCIIIWNVAV